ncbi:hypothetical protein ACR6C2_21225 [Streptomyces sp. INA 01156]
MTWPSSGSCRRRPGWAWSPGCVTRSTGAGRGPRSTPRPPCAASSPAWAPGRGRGGGRGPLRGGRAGGADPRPEGPTANRPAPPPAEVPPSGAGTSAGARETSCVARSPPRPAGNPHPAPAAGVPSRRTGRPDELGDSAAQPDWWRVDDSPFGVGDEVTGFVGGVEIPELLKPRRRRNRTGRRAGREGPAPAVVEAGTDTDTGAGTAAGSRSARRRFVRLPSGRWSNPLLLVAAGLLVVGAVLGNWFALFLGWVIAYASRRLTRAEIKWAVVVLPGLAIAGGIVWLWGRTEERWGTPVADGAMNDAVFETWPWVVRAAAVTSALFLTWRSQRPR